MVDHFEDHLIRCGHDPLRIIFYIVALFIMHYWRIIWMCGRNRRCLGNLLLDLVIFFIRILTVVIPPTYFDVSVRNALHSGVVSHSAIIPGFAAFRGEMEKDDQHNMLVEAAGGEFLPLLVDNLGIWTPLSVEILCSIAQISTVRNGLSTGKAFHHLVEWLIVQLYHYNAKMIKILCFWALHPHSKDD